jgi:hypothetical protein
VLRHLFPLALALGAGILAGCGDSKNATVGSDAKDPLKDLGEMLKSLSEEKRKPPSKLSELESVEPLIPLAGPKIRSGEIVYVWGTEYAAGGNKIAAYEKKAATEGGWILLQNGTVKQVTVDEFNAAKPK